MCCFPVLKCFGARKNITGLLFSGKIFFPKKICFVEVRRLARSKIFFCITIDVFGKKENEITAYFFATTNFNGYLQRRYGDNFFSQKAENPRVSTKLRYDLSKIANLTIVPTPAPIREFEDFPLRIQFGRKKNHNLRFLNRRRVFMQRRRKHFLNPRKYTSSNRCGCKLKIPSVPI